MAASTEYSFIRYLSSKRTVDDRALNRCVWNSLHAQLRGASVDHPFTVLEIGAGIGTMLERMVEVQLLPACRYVLLDAQRANMETATQRLAVWAADHFGETPAPKDAPPFALAPLSSFQVDAPGVPEIDVFTYAHDLFHFLESVGAAPVVDLLVAHAFIDLVDVPSTLQRLKAVLRPGALIYLTINFDGATILQPEIDAALDAQIERLYHATMDQRRLNGLPSGDSRTGRHLFGHLQNAGIQVLDAGSSDWVVFPYEHTYPADEAYFLHFILHTLDGALRGAPRLDPERFDAWLAARHRQIDEGTLIYIAHQLDLLGRFGG